jgi:hypothetical protein
VNASYSIPHYRIRRQDRFWLLERADTGQGLVFFDTQKKAVERGELLALAAMPSCLAIYHDSHQIEERRYPSPSSEIKDTHAFLGG